MKPTKHLVCLAVVAAGFLATMSVKASLNPEGTNSPTAKAPGETKVAGNADQAPQSAADVPSASGTTVPQPAQSDAASNSPAVQVTSLPAQSAIVSAQDSGTSSAAEFPANKGLRMNFRGAPLEMVLNYMSKAAGFIINVTRSVDVKGRIDIWSEQPLTKEESVELLKKVLNQNGYTVIQDNRILTIISSSQAKNNEGTPIEEVLDFRTIPRDTAIVTEVIPVRSLNPGALLKDLQDMLPRDTTIVANENANSLIMTDTHANIRRIAEIVATLDSVSAGVNTLQVFPLKYADAKTVADMLKELFSAQDSSSRNVGGGNRFGRFAMGMYAGGGPPEGGGGSSGQAPTTHVGAVADDHSNSVIVSAPDGLMALITNVIGQIDVSVQAVTTYKVFKLKHADPVEMAELLSSLYPDDNSTPGAASQGPPGRGGFFSAMLAASQGANKNSSEASNRAKLMGRVNAVPDPRTGWLVVTAAKDLMPDIEDMVNQLDESPAKIVKPHIVSLVNADPYDVLQVLQDVVPPNPAMKTPSTSSTTQNNSLLNRANTLSQSQNANQSTQSSGFNAPGR